ncbi:MAG: hypothetical protein JWP42_4471 [Pseudomonas sp.]|nr:hypothetical protein [Pseudomonas sp.]
MSLCLFLSASAGADPAPVDVAQLDLLLKAVGGVVKSAIHLPTTLKGGDPFLQVSDIPLCVIQLYFSSLDDLESALTATSPLVGLFDIGRFPGLAECRWTQQAMLTRCYPVPEPLAAQAHAGRLKRVTYLVAYEGPAEDDDAWLAHYIRQHPPLMVLLPGIREVEVYTRIDYCSDLPAVRAKTLQRNKAVFDSTSALNAALASPIREELRNDFLTLPPFTGASPHYPMQTFEQHLPAKGSLTRAPVV